MKRRIPYIWTLKNLPTVWTGDSREWRFLMGPWIKRSKGITDPEVSPGQTSGS
jgi:hypothetical protein